MKLVGFIAGALFWIFDSILDAFVFGESDFYETLFAPEPVEIWMQFIIFCLLIGIGMIADLVIVTLRRVVVVFHGELENQVADQTKGLCIIHDNFFRMVSLS